MRYCGIDVTLSEVPNEISLTILMSGCPNGCPDCHSKLSWDKNYGKEINSDIMKNILSKYKDSVSCVVFLGGEWNKEFINLLNICKINNLKTCLYSGLDNIDLISKNIINKLDYIKIGSYNKKYGDLSNKNSNQKFYNLKDGKLIDLTHLFYI